MGKCNNYTPDIQAQGDCIQCGCAFEDHESKKEYKPLSEWAPFKVGERFVRKGYDDCWGVIVVHSANLPTFMVSGWKCGGLSFFDGILYTPLDRDTVEPEPDDPQVGMAYVNATGNNITKGVIPYDPQVGMAYVNATGNNITEAAVNFDMLGLGDELANRILYLECTISFDRPKNAQTSG